MTTQPDRILHDLDHDDMLGRQGYVVVDLLSQEQVHRLHTEWSRHLEAHRPVWDPTGLAASIRHPDQAWVAHERILDVVAGPVSELMIERQCFMSTFLTKRSGSDRLPEHLDWRLADEPEELTHGCWIALSDIDAVDGPLGVLPGTHRLVDFDRTPEQPGHLWCEEVVAGGAPSVTIPMRAGQAVVFDHRLVHFSDPNVAATPRGAANLGLCRSGSGDRCATTLLDMMDRGMRGIGSDPQIPTQ